MKRALALPLALVFALLFAVPVSAAPPVIESGTSTDVHLAYDRSSPCPGIEIWDREELYFRFTTYFDDQGNVLRIHAFFSGVDNFYNFAKPENVLSGHFAGSGELDPNTGDIVVGNGAPYHITAPGYGTVLVRAGRWLLHYPDGQIAGKNSLIDPNDMAQFCSLLARN